MYFFVIAAALISIAHFAAAAQRPRLAMAVAGVMWVAYAVYEYYVASGVLCDSDCNIRVDLVAIFPALAIATAYGHWSWRKPVPPNTIAGYMLGSSGILLCAGVVFLFGYQVAAAALCLAAVAIIAYAIKSKLSASRA